MEVELIKIGEIMKQPSHTLIMLADEDEPAISHYISILKEHCEKNYPDYKFMKTKGIIRSSGENNYWSGNPFSNPPNMVAHRHLRGTSDSSPVIGQAFTINNSSWHTSPVEIIISDNIIITKNSVYAIHDASIMRDQKLKDLGI